VASCDLVIYLSSVLKFKTNKKRGDTMFLVKVGLIYHDQLLLSCYLIGVGV